MRKKYHTLKTVPDCNRKIVERGTIGTPNTHKKLTPTFLAWYRHFNKIWYGLSQIYEPDHASLFHL